MSTEMPGLVSAYRFDASGQPHRLTDDQVESALAMTDAGWVWLHLNLTDQRARNWVDSRSGLPDRARALLLSSDHHLRLEALDDAVIAVLPDIAHGTAPTEPVVRNGRGMAPVPVARLQAGAQFAPAPPASSGTPPAASLTPSLLPGAAEGNAAGTASGPGTRPPEPELAAPTDSPTLEFAPLHIALAQRLVVSGRYHPLHCPERVREQLAQGRRVHRPAQLLELLNGQLASTLSNVLTGMSDTLDDVEDKVLDDAPHDERHRLGPLRRIVVGLRRQLEPLRSMYATMAEAPEGEVPEAMLDMAGRNAQRLDVLIHDLDAIQERARLLNEQIAMEMAELTNRQLYTLSIMSALLLPPTLVTGIFGMNTSGLPFTDEGGKGSYWALGIAVVAAVAAFLLLVRIGVARRPQRN